MSDETPDAVTEDENTEPTAEGGESPEQHLIRIKNLHGDESDAFTRVFPIPGDLYDAELYDHSDNKRETVKEAERAGLRAAGEAELVSDEVVRGRAELTYRVPVELAGDNEATRKAAAGFNESKLPVADAGTEI